MVARFAGRKLIVLIQYLELLIALLHLTELFFFTPGARLITLFLADPAAIKFVGLIPAILALFVGLTGGDGFS